MTACRALALTEERVRRWRDLPNCPDVGNDHCPGVYRPGFPFLRRLVSHLPGRRRHLTEERLDRRVDSVHRRRSRQFLWRRDVRYLIKRGCPVGAARIALVVFGGIGVTLLMPTVFHRQSVGPDATVQTRNIHLRVVHDDRQRAALRPFRQRVPLPPYVASAERERRSARSWCSSWPGISPMRAWPQARILFDPLMPRRPHPVYQNGSGTAAGCGQDLNSVRAEGWFSWKKQRERRG